MAFLHTEFFNFGLVVVLECFPEVLSCKRAGIVKFIQTVLGPDFIAGLASNQV